jgi:hypothetical protein
MAIVGTSIFDISGKLGDLVYYRYKGRRMVRKAPAVRKNNPSPLQLENQAKFVLMGNFLRPLSGLLEKTYNINNRKKSSHQKAFSENYYNALTGKYPTHSIDYSKVRLGRGLLCNCAEATVHSPDPGKLVVSWPESENWRQSMSSDQVYVAVYSEKLNRWIYKRGCTERCKKICRVDVAPFSGTRVHVYMGFNSADGKQASDSLYTGSLMIS